MHFSWSFFCNKVAAQAYNLTEKLGISMNFTKSLRTIRILPEE